MDGQPWQSPAYGAGPPGRLSNAMIDDDLSNHANCFFGPPIPISPPTPALATCIVNPFTTDVCGALDTASLTSSLNFGLSTRLYLTQNPTQPCPLCQNNVCTAGARQGLACSGGIGSFQTSNECPPSPSQFVGSITSNPIAVSTGTSVMTADTDGFFCPGQPASIDLTLPIQDAQ